MTDVVPVVSTEESDLAFSCPVCKRLQRKRAEDGLCIRCGTDLSTCWHVRETAHTLYLQGCSVLPEQPEKAARYFKESWGLHHRRETAEAWACSYLMAGSWRGACQFYAGMQQENGALSIPLMKAERLSYWAIFRRVLRFSNGWKIFQWLEK